MHRTRSQARTAAAALWRCAAVGALAAVIAACGTRAVHVDGGGAGSTRSSPVGGTRSDGPSPVSATPSNGSPTAPATTCLPSGIRVTLDLRSAGVAAGNSYVPIDFTNVSALPCRLGGFPVVTLGSRSGRQVGNAGQQDSSQAAESLMLAAGQTAHAWLHLADVMNLPTTQCQPVAVAGLRIALPGQASATFISDALTTCHKQIHGTEILTIEPFRPGLPRRGTAG